MGMNPPLLGDPGKVLMTTLGASPADIADNVIITPFIPLKSFARHLDPESITELNPRFFYKGLTGAGNGRRITVILTGVGPSRIGDAVSILSLTGAKRLLFAGAVGGLSEKLEIGRFMIPGEAADGEGYTRYTLESFEKIVGEAPVITCPGTLSDKLAGHLEGKGHAPARGRIFTIGTIAFESEENLRTIKDHGYDALEMELSAFFAAAARHGMDAAALTYVSDLPLKSSLWQEKTPEENLKLSAAWRALPALAVEFMAREGE